MIEPTPYLRRRAGGTDVVSDDALREARLLTRYLLDSECPPALAARYATARASIGAASGGGEARVAEFAFRHPWSLPLLDAAGAVVGGGAALRTRVYLMAAVLEASRDYAAWYLEPVPGPFLTVARLAGSGARAAAKALVGIPLLLALRGGAR
jgi:hypothetical protein